MEKTLEVQNVIGAVVRALVNTPEKVRVELVEGQQSVIVDVYTAAGEAGQVIGRRGRTADALRELLVNMGGRLNRRLVLNIIGAEKAAPAIVELSAATKLFVDRVDGPEVVRRQSRM